MKKISLLFVVSLFTISLFAQDVKFGIKGGLNISSVQITPSQQGINSKLGGNLGLLAHIHLSKQWGLQPELQFSTQGMEQTYLGTKYKYNLNYINIPVLLQYMFENGFRLQAGPQLGFLAGAKQTGGGGTTNIKNDYKSTDVSLSFGLGYLSYSGFGVDARYNLGVTNINNAGSTQLKNRVGQISLFYMLDNQHKTK